MNALTWEAPNLLAAEAYALWGEAIEKAPEKMFAPVLKRFRMGKGPDSAALGAKWKRREELRRLYLEETAGYDAVLLPTVSLSPPPIEGLMEDDAAYGKANVSALRNTTLGNPRPFRHHAACEQRRARPSRRPYGDGRAAGRGTPPSPRPLP